MKRKKLYIEYPLTTKSPNIVWSLISNATGLSKWIADYVSEEGNCITFTWGQPWTQQESRVAYIIEKCEAKKIVFRWVDEEEDDAYLKMEIEQSELTGLCSLHVTDFTEPDDFNYLKNLWDENMNRLHQASGI